MQPYKCPECGDPNHIEIVATTRVRLLQYKLSDDIQTVDDGVSDCSHDWGEDSLAFCMECGHHAKMFRFRVKEEVPA